jgi:hypothetical protein
MRKLVGLLLVIVAGVATAQTPQDFRNRYGEPQGEVFSARPGIGLSVEYGSDHVACQIVLKPTKHTIGRQDEAQFMSSATVTEILDEVVPATARGKKLNEGYVNRGCNEIDFTEYENVSISRSTHNCLPLKPEREMSATVTFKRDVCRSQFSSR